MWIIVTIVAYLAVGFVFTRELIKRDPPQRGDEFAVIPILLFWPFAMIIVAVALTWNKFFADKTGTEILDAIFHIKRKS